MDFVIYSGNFTSPLHLRYIGYISAKRIEKSVKFTDKNRLLKQKNQYPYRYYNFLKADT